MTLDYCFSFPLLGGLHARPAAVLRERALAHDATCELLNERTGNRAKLTNVLSLLATDTRHGDPCRISAEGPGARTALADLASFVPAAFLASDIPTEAPSAKGRTGTAIAQILARAGCTCWEGTPVAPGIGSGPALRVQTARTVPVPATGLDPATEWTALRRALAAVLAHLNALPGHPALRAILEAQAAMLQDEAWVNRMEQAVGEGRSAAEAVLLGLEAAQAGLRVSENPYLRERTLDLQDLGDRLLDELGLAPESLELPDPCVLVATELTPSRLLALDRTRVRALVLADGAATSHTAILARSFGLPCVVCPEATSLVDGQALCVDGERGLVLPAPPPELMAYYAIQTQERARRLPSGSGSTADGLAIALHANILSPLEVEPALRFGAEGIGLFRSEMLFLDRQAAPPEEEQYQAYRQALEAAQGKPVVLRLLDVGGDKPLPYLPLPQEANPYLGRRGVRWYSLYPEVVATQIRAALRASVHGPLRLMIPMVTEVEEIRAVRALVQAAGAEGTLPLGIMVEVPAAALNLAALAREADFFCVGTNDLVQYLFAADRSDARVSSPSHDWHPATLRTLARIVTEAKEAGCPLSLCGEMAGKPALLPLLVGLGFESLSMAPGLLPEARRTLAGLDSQRCRVLAQTALQLGSAQEVEALLQTRTSSPGCATLMDLNLLILDAPCASKEEAIKLLAERCAAQGRVRDPLAFEEAIWDREAEYATGMGFGFAVPHCKAPSVEAASLAILRLATPLEWGSLDGLPVDFLLLLATSGEDGGQEHLRVFARLARKLMQEAFRTALRAADSPQAILELLETHVLVTP